MSQQHQSSPDDTFRYSAEPEAAAVPSTTNYGRWAWLLVLAGVLLILGWVSIKGFRTWQAAQGLLSLQTDAQALLAEGPMDVDPDAALALVTGARSDLATLNRELAFIGPLTPLLGGLPQVGPLLVAAPPLLEMADAGSEAAALAVESLAPALAVVQQENFGAGELGALLPLLQEATPQLQAAAEAMDRYATARAGLDAAVEIEALPWRVQQLIALADEWTPAGQAALELAPQLPLLLGMNGPQRYLIMAQNEDELRSTGGFLTGAGLLTIENGRILDISLTDANSVDNWLDKPYDEPPQPYYDFMLSEMFLFRDANFWPDFPTSARKALELYAYGQDVSGLAGAIAIDQEFLRLLVEATGPVALDGGGEIDAGNLIETLHAARDPEEGQEVGDWVTDRKAFLGGFAAAIRTKLEADFTSIDPLTLARNMKTALDEHHLQIYVTDAMSMESLSEVGWDGALPASVDGDFWMVVDTNMGFNKVNYFINRSFDYSIDLSNSNNLVANLVTTFHHSGTPSGEPCYQGVEEEFEQGEAYLALANKCYWNYVRVYVPPGSTLLDSTRHVVPAETLFRGTTWDSQAQAIQEQDNLTTFANFLLVPQGQAADFAVTYSLPAGVIQALDDGSTLYELEVQKQAGTRPEPMTIAITIPANAELLEATPAFTTINGNQILFDTELTSDTVFRLRFR